MCKDWRWASIGLIVGGRYFRLDLARTSRRNINRDRRPWTNRAHRNVHQYCFIVLSWNLLQGGSNMLTFETFQPLYRQLMIWTTCYCLTKISTHLVQTTMVIVITKYTVTLIWSDLIVSQQHYMPRLEMWKSLLRSRPYLLRRSMRWPSLIFPLHRY